MHFRFGWVYASPEEGERLVPTRPGQPWAPPRPGGAQSDPRCPHRCHLVSQRLHGPRRCGGDWVEPGLPGSGRPRGSWEDGQELQLQPGAIGTARHSSPRTFFRTRHLHVAGQFSVLPRATVCRPGWAGMSRGALWGGLRTRPRLRPPQLRPQRASDWREQPDAILSQARWGCCRGQPRSPSDHRTLMSFVPRTITCLENVPEDRLQTRFQGQWHYWMRRQLPGHQGDSLGETGV